ncbi:MAG: hypothetical protein L0H23_06615 [Luteimonas sp.]|nr:hypothetical protein [Luteimonas sp.]
MLPLQAQEFQKCRGGRGATAYRSKSCLPGETLVAVLEPVADPPSAQPRTAAESAPRKPRAARTSKRSQTGRTARNGWPRSNKRAKRGHKNPCKSAKKARDDFQRRRGIKVTMDDLSRWNHRVYDACK